MIRAWGAIKGKAGAVLVADEAAVRTEAHVQAGEVARRAATDPVHKDMALLDAMAEGQL